MFFFKNVKIRNCLNATLLNTPRRNVDNITRQINAILRLAQLGPSKTRKYKIFFVNIVHFNIRKIRIARYFSV